MIYKSSVLRIRIGMMGISCDDPRDVPIIFAIIIDISAYMDLFLVDPH